MAVEKVKVSRDALPLYVGLSTDTKPTASAVPPGSKFYESDTGLTYFASAAGWTELLMAVVGGYPKSADHRLMRFDAVADMPADITSAANVAADRIELDTFSGAVRRLQLIWHGAGITGPDTQGTQAFFGEIALGALISINAQDDTEANSRLTFTDLTGGGTSSAGKTDVFMVSKSSPILDIYLDAALTRVDVIGIPNGLSTTHLDLILPCFLELRAFS